MQLKRSHYIFLGIFFILIGLTNTVANVYEYSSLTGIFWFCSLTVYIFALGLILKNNFLISTVVTSSLIIEVLWIIDFVSFLATGNLTLGIFTYLIKASTLRIVITAYHIFILIFPVSILLKSKKFHKYSWLGASLFLLIVSGITLIFTPSDSNINCVRESCDLGLFNIIQTSLNPSFLPQILINWITLTLMIFLPTHLILYYATKYLIKQKKNTKKN